MYNRLVKLLGGAILATAVAGSKQSLHYRSYQCNESVGSCDLQYRVTAFVLSWWTKSVDRGENHYKSNHVEAFLYSAGSLREKVHANMKARSEIMQHKVTVSWQGD